MLCFVFRDIKCSSILGIEYGGPQKRDDMVRSIKDEQFLLSLAADQNMSNIYPFFFSSLPPYSIFLSCHTHSSADIIEKINFVSANVIFCRLDIEQQREQYICNDSIDSISNNHKTGPRRKKTGNYFSINYSVSSTSVRLSFKIFEL